MPADPAVGAVIAVQGVPTPDPEYLLVHYPNVTKLVIAAALGLLMGIEREWSQKPAGLRTFTIISTLGAVTVIAGESGLVALGGLLVVIQGSIFAAAGLFGDEEKFLLTTSVSMVLAYVIGVLVAKSLFFEGVLAAVATTLLLVLRPELHGFAQNLEKAEIRSAVEFAVIAFVVYPHLPNDPIDPWNAVVPQTVWLLVVVISLIGFLNYLVVARYGAKGIAVTSFFGGLVNSTAVIGEMVSRTRKNPALDPLAVGSIMLANAAMATRDLLIAVAFIPGINITLIAPLGTIVVTGIILSYVMSDWMVTFKLDFDSPFNLRSALTFGGLFLVVLVLSAGAQSAYGASGLLVSSFLSGLVSSGAVTTSAVLLVQSGNVSVQLASGAIIAGVTASILAKLGLVVSMNRTLTRPVAVATSVLVAAGATVAGLIMLFV
ncbi:MAG: MgtC/SapB family protein [Halodesulfurarchaeum sp.]